MSTNQLTLIDSEDLNSSEKIFADAFKDLYYHLYSNSNSSRAERIITDLSNILLIKIASERNDGGKILKMYLAKDDKANNLLIPFLRSSYPNLIEQDEKFSLSDKDLRYCFQTISHLSFHEAPAHILGEAFQSLIGPRLRGDKGQFFTPKNLIRAIITIIDPTPKSTIIDPACGTGGFLVEAQAYLDKKDPKNKKAATNLIAIDKDKDLSRLTEAILNIVSQNSTVLNENSLNIKDLKKLPKEMGLFNADYILTNPPFGSKIKITEKNILEQYELGHKWAQKNLQWEKESVIKDAQDPQILFIELCIRMLKPGGKMGMVLPEGVFGNPGLGYVWDYIRSHGKILALLDCPRTTFQPSTDTKTNVLFFEKTDSSNLNEDYKIWTAVALACGHDRRGKATKLNGERYPDDFYKIASSFSTKQSEYWQSVELTDKYYLVPRYYDKTPMLELQNEARKMNGHLISVGEMLNKGYLKIHRGHEVGAEAYGSGDVPFIRTSDISNYEISIDPNRSVSEDIYSKYNEQQNLKPGDILFVGDGRYRIGRTAILNQYNYRCVVQSHLKIITINKSSPLTEYEFLYLMNLPMVQHQIRNLVFIQSTLGSLGSRLKKVLIPIPSKTKNWESTIERFKNILEERASLLKDIRKFEHEDYEL